MSDLLGIAVVAGLAALVRVAVVMVKWATPEPEGEPVSLSPGEIVVDGEEYDLLIDVGWVEIRPGVAESPTTGTLALRARELVAPPH